MFEHFGFSYFPRYGEDAVRKNPLNRKVKLICTPEFEEIFNSIFSGVDFDEIGTRHSEEEDSSEVAMNKTPGKPFKWTVGESDEGDDYDGYDDYDGQEDEPSKTPKTILESDLDFERMFGKVDGEDEDDEPPYIHEQDVVYAEDDEDDEDERDENVKNPFVFIANRLTFLAQTVQPIIFDTSLIETGSDYITIAVNEDKTFPKIRSFDELGFITCKLNCCQTIRDEIGEFIKGTEYTDIFCFPEFLSKSGPGTDVFAIKFVCYKRK